MIQNHPQFKLNRLFISFDSNRSNVFSLSLIIVNNSVFYSNFFLPNDVDSDHDNHIQFKYIFLIAFVKRIFLIFQIIISIFLICKKILKTELEEISKGIEKQKSEKIN